MALLKISVVVPEGEVYTGEVKSVVLPGVEGEFGVLYGHSNLITLLQAGVVEIETENQKNTLLSIGAMRKLLMNGWIF